MASWHWLRHPSTYHSQGLRVVGLQHHKFGNAVQIFKVESWSASSNAVYRRHLFHIPAKPLANGLEVCQPHTGMCLLGASWVLPGCIWVAQIAQKEERKTSLESRTGLVVDSCVNIMSAWAVDRKFLDIYIYTYIYIYSPFGLLWLPLIVFGASLAPPGPTLGSF